MNSDSQSGIILFPKDHLSVSGSIFDCYNAVGRWYWHAVSVEQGRCYILQYPAGHRMTPPPQRNDLVQHVHGAKGDKPGVMRVTMKKCQAY